MQIGSFCYVKIQFKSKAERTQTKAFLNINKICYICFQKDILATKTAANFTWFDCDLKMYVDSKTGMSNKENRNYVALLLLHHCRLFSDTQTIHTFSENLVFLSRSFCIPPASHSSITKYIRCKWEEMHIHLLNHKNTVMALKSVSPNCTACQDLKVLYFDALSWLYKHYNL